MGCSWGQLERLLQWSNDCMPGGTRVDHPEQEGEARTIRSSRPPLLRRYYIDITGDAMVCSFDSESTTTWSWSLTCRYGRVVYMVIYHLRGGSRWVFMWRSPLWIILSHSCSSAIVPMKFINGMGLFVALTLWWSCREKLYKLFSYFALLQWINLWIQFYSSILFVVICTTKD